MLCTELVEHGLKVTTRMGIEEMVAMFLNMVGHAQGCLSNILSRKILNFVIVIQKFEKIDDIGLYFKNVIGAIDGTHVSCVVGASQQARFIGRMGYPTQNIMTVCDWNMCFTFALPGWEGSAHDARIFYHALTTPNFYKFLSSIYFLKSKYYLVDAGYPTPIGYIGPYKCERYHLPDFRRSSSFANHNEVFNYYYSSVRCTIERTFWVWKNRFAILRHMPKFKIETQVHIIIATMTIHNFIRRKSETDSDFNLYEGEDMVELDDDDDHGSVDPSVRLTVASSTKMDLVRDSIRDQIVEHMKLN
ncbi:hypothetical protein GQ457_07G016480 [Hibiscus cannabinus]